MEQGIPGNSDNVEKCQMISEHVHVRLQQFLNSPCHYDPVNVWQRAFFWLTHWSFVLSPVLCVYSAACYWLEQHSSPSSPHRLLGSAYIVKYISQDCNTHAVYHFNEQWSYMCQNHLIPQSQHVHSGKLIAVFVKSDCSRQHQAGLEVPVQCYTRKIYLSKQNLLWMSLWSPI